MGATAPQLSGHTATAADTCTDAALCGGVVYECLVDARRFMHKRSHPHIAARGHRIKQHADRIAHKAVRELAAAAQRHGTHRSVTDERPVKAPLAIAEIWF